MGKARSTNTIFNSTSVDFLGMYNKIFNQLQATRGLDPLRSGILIERTDQFAATSNGESIMNTFLRVLGLPAIRNDTLISSQYNLSLASNNNLMTQNETINYFSQSDLKINLLQVEFRETDLQKLYSRSQIQLNETVAIEALSFMLDPEAIDESVFVPVVSGDVTVYPLSRRVAPLFYDGDYYDGNTILPKAFIESVIYNTYFKSEDSVAESEIRSSIETITGSAISAESLKDKNLLVLRFLQKSISAMQAASNTYFAMQSYRDQLFQKVSYVPALKRSGPGVKQGFFDVDFDVIKSLLISDEGKELLTRLTEPELDKTIKLQQELVSEDDSFYGLLPFNVIKQQEQILRAGSGLTSNPSETFFADVVVDLATIDRKPKADALSRLKEERRVLRNELEQIRGLFEVFGTSTTGISIFQIIATLNALYLLPEKDLLGLLNQSALDRLLIKQKSIAFGSEDIAKAILERSSVADAIAALSDKIADQLNLAQLFYDQSSQSGTK